MIKESVLITGASSGIGRELSRLFAREGFNLVITSRNEEQLRVLAEELKGSSDIHVTVIPKDLSVDNAADELYAEVTRGGTQLDILVNNAGYATYGLFVDSNVIHERNMMQLNIVALAHLTHLFLKGMISRGKGKILNVASTAAFQPGPLMAVYYASKAFVLSFSEALVEETRGTGVTVTALCPGPTRSGFQERANMQGVRTFKPMFLMNADSVARVGYSGLMKGKAVVIPGKLNKIVPLMVRFSPRFLVRRVVAWIQGCDDEKKDSPSTVPDKANIK